MTKRLLCGDARDLIYFRTNPDKLSYLSGLLVVDDVVVAGEEPKTGISLELRNKGNNEDRDECLCSIDFMFGHCCDDRADNNPLDNVYGEDPGVPCQCEWARRLLSV